MTTIVQALADLGAFAIGAVIGYILANWVLDILNFNKKE